MFFFQLSHLISSDGQSMWHHRHHNVLHVWYDNRFLKQNNHINRVAHWKLKSTLKNKQIATYCTWNSWNAFFSNHLDMYRTNGMLESPNIGCTDSVRFGVGRKPNQTLSEGGGGMFKTRVPDNPITSILRIKSVFETPETWHIAILLISDKNTLYILEQKLTHRIVL